MTTWKIFWKQVTEKLPEFSSIYVKNTLADFDIDDKDVEVLSRCKDAKRFTTRNSTKNRNDNKM